MTPEPPTPTPRRKRRYFLWLGVLLLVLFAYRGWKEYDYRAAVKEAGRLGWVIQNTSPFDDIKRDWRAAIRMKTWTDIRRGLGIYGKDGLIGHESLILRLNPQAIGIDNCPSSLNLSFLKHLSDLRMLEIAASPELTDANMDQIAELTDLKDLRFIHCKKFTRLNPLIKLTNLKMLILIDFPSIHQGDIKAFKTAHPNTQIAYSP